MGPLPAAVCAAGRSLADPLVSPDGSRVAFVARGPDGGRLVVVPSVGGGGGNGDGERVAAVDPEPAGRGGVVAWLPDGRRLAYVTRDGGVAVVEVGAGPARLVAEGVEGGAGALTASPDGTRLAFVADARAVTVVAVAGGPPAVVSDQADFAVDPCWSADGARLAWHEWDVPAMPWDESRIVVAPAVAGGGAGKDRVVVAGGDGVAVQEPRFSPDGSALAFLSDATGWCNLWVADAGGVDPRCLVAEAHEHGGPVWGPGGRSFAWSPDSRSIAFCRNEAGFGRLSAVEVATGRVRQLSRGVHSSLSWAGDTLTGLRSGARTPTSVVAVHPSSEERTVLTTGPAPELAAAAPALPEPDVVSWTALDGAVVHGRLYTPPGVGPGRPPLLVWAHGGPTDQRRVTFDARAAFFLSRGWAILHPDPRGTTGWGRSWAQGLRGRWGEVDVDDVAAGAQAVAERGWGDPSRMVAMGGSAGGMTALLLLARRPELWAAGVALYPVVDLEGLAAATHRYEAHYTVGLVGPLPAAAALHRARSPISVADGIAAPLLLLHGSADVVVPPGQSAELARLLRTRGVAVEHHEYEGEGHGWRSPDTLRDELERTDSFLSRHLVRRSAEMGR